MAGIEGQPHFSKRTVNLGEKLQRLPGAGLVVGSSSPAYVRLEWSRLPDVDAEELALTDIPGDPNAGKFPRWRRNAAVLGLDAETEQDMLVRMSQEDEAGYDVVVFELDGDVHMGESPEFFFGREYAGSSFRAFSTAAMRLGIGPLRATMGFYVPTKEKLNTPDTPPTVLASSILNDAIPDRYPSTLLV